MSHRFKWAFHQALQATLTCTILLMFAAAIFEGSNKGAWHLASAICLLLILPPIMVRTQQYYNAYEVHTVASTRRGVVLEIGHYTGFMDRFRLEQIGTNKYIGHRQPMPFGQGHIFALLYDNDMMVVTNDDRQLQQVHAVLRESWPYNSLVSQCEVCQPMMMWSKANNENVMEVQVA